MYCKNCGKEIDKSSSFCPDCGENNIINNQSTQNVDNLPQPFNVVKGKILQVAITQLISGVIFGAFFIFSVMGLKTGINMIKNEYYEYADQMPFIIIGLIVVTLILTISTLLTILFIKNAIKNFNKTNQIQLKPYDIACSSINQKSKLTNIFLYIFLAISVLNPFFLVIILPIIIVNNKKMKDLSETAKSYQGRLLDIQQKIKDTTY